MRKRFFLLALFLLMLFTEKGYGEEWKKVKVGFDPNLPPFSFISEDGSPAGYNADLMYRIARNSGWELEFIPLHAEQFLPQLQQGYVDVILGMKYRGSYEQMFDFSESIFTMSEALIVPKEDKTIYDITDLKGRVVAVQRGTAAREMLDNVRQVKMNVTSSEPHAMRMLFLERADAFIGNRWTAQYLLEQNQVVEDYDIRLSFIQPSEYSFAVREGNLELLTAINQSLQKIRQTKEYRTIYNYWFEPYNQQAIWWQRTAWLLAWISMIAIIIISLITIWNKRLKREVDKQTRVLTHYLTFQREVLERVDNGILTCDKDRKITLMNRRASEILGTNPNIKDLPLDSSPQLCDLSLVLDKTQPGQGQSGELVWGNSSGTQYIYYYVALLEDGSGGWIISLQDRTEQIQLQEKLRIQEKLRALGQLVAGIAHELRNPLTSMKMFIDVLPKKVEDPRFREELIKHVPAEMNRLNHLVEELLDYTRKKEPVKESVEWNELLSSIIRSFKISTEHEINFEIHFEEASTVFGDRQRVRQVLINLISNAIDALEDQPTKKITITSREDEEYSYLKVADTGKGMTKIQIDNMFQPFFTTKGNGVGLGLYISYNIMVEHGGEIEVMSQEGEGTTITLKFPREGRS
ncbi:transporter substrate-binding domain-containing protein [Ammoniphilus sp. CFH 90114]|uniref:transporter substrate-binding domain-containing protein n=1 Tax=Ammoniphilus sp. CFH 90114 TaxID=2493665 RepID=UPI00100F5EBD|nr:transporter substrate-binding domain-containing protein [Ammoniphilus sp. CFH 90114]RXT09096.1 transporter substrate-binding domain-containing protein [Ammoniphilus sp. CFH 90114]